MSDAVEEIISEYVDALNEGAAEPVDVFLARFGGLEPATAAGLARTLSLLAGAAPALKDYDHRRASWQRLEALIEAQPAASGVGQPSETAEAPLLRGGASELHYHEAGAVSGSRIYIRPQHPPREPAAHRVISWRPFAAALLLGLVALLLAMFGPGRAPAPFFPERLIAPPAGSTVVPDGDSPDSPYSMVVEPLVADGNLVVLSYGAIEVGFSPEQRANRPLEVSADMRLTSLDGRPLPRLATGFGNSIMTRTQEFDASGLMVTATELDVRVVMTAFVGPLDTAGWHRPYGVQFPTPTPSVGPLPPKATVHVDRTLRLKFDPRRRIAEPGLADVGRGITVTLERVVSTASETRFYYSGRPGNGGRIPELRTGSRDFSMTEHGGVDYMSSMVRETDGVEVLRVGARLLDEPSPWVLTFPEVTTYDSIGLPPEKQTWIGPWVFYFAMPDADVSLTPGPVPSLPPATPRPTDVPGAVPTQQAPISGPVAPTALPTAAVDLPWLAQQAEVVVRVKITGSSGAGGVVYFRTEVMEWLKRPANLIADIVTLNIENRQLNLTPLWEAHKDGSADEFILFLNPRGPRQPDGVPHYQLAHPVAGAFVVRNGEIVAAGISRFQGWPVDRFLQEVRSLVPASPEIEQPVHDLAILGQYAVRVAEIEWTKSEPLRLAADGGKHLLRNARVLNWLKDRPDQGGEFVGLVLTEEEHALLSGGSGRYVLFLTLPDGGGTCAGNPFPGYYALLDGATGVFELTGEHIGRAGIAAYEGRPVEAIRETLAAYVPTPDPSWNPGYPLSLSEEVRTVQYIAEVELTGQGRPGDNPYWQIDTFKVRGWIKKPAGFTAESLEVVRTASSGCEWLLGPGPYILFLRDHKFGSNETPQPGRYDLFGTYGIRNGAVEYGTLRQYWGWPLERFVAEIQGVMP